MPESVEALARRISACRHCIENPSGRPLPHAPRPVAVLSRTARIAICGQAPGTRVHASGVPFSDPSGDRLRAWMGVGPEIFYDRARIAIVPMGFCFPGLDGKGGDLPPRRECAGVWRERVFEAMPQIELVLAVGAHAQNWHLGRACRTSLTETVRDWRAILGAGHAPAIFPLPHPSWRNNVWIKKNRWFASDLIPELRKMITVLV